MRSEERIQDLCARVVQEKNPDKVAELLAELKEALREHRQETAAMVLIHRRLFKDVA